MRRGAPTVVSSMLSRKIAINTMMSTSCRLSSVSSFACSDCSEVLGGKLSAVAIGCCCVPVRGSALEALAGKLGEYRPLSLASWDGFRGAEEAAAELVDWCCMLESSASCPFDGLQQTFYKSNGQNILNSIKNSIYI